MSDRVILYDLPSKGRCASWSYNPWKTRLALNYKGIDYKTKFIEYPDLEPYFSKTDLPPNSDPPAYAIPTIRLPDSTLIQDSSKIAPALESLQPAPPLHLSDPILKEVQTSLSSTATAIGPIFRPKVWSNILNPASATYFRATREERSGLSFEEAQKPELVEKAWREAEKGIRELSELLKVHSSGPYFLGTEVSYADFVLVSWLQFCKRVDEVGLFERFVDHDREGFLGLFEACGEWLVRDD